MVDAGADYCFAHDLRHELLLQLAGLVVVARLRRIEAVMSERAEMEFWEAEGQVLMARGFTLCAGLYYQPALAVPLSLREHLDVGQLHRLGRLRVRQIADPRPPKNVIGLDDAD